MKKTILCVFAAMIAVSTFAQSSDSGLRVWENNVITYQAPVDNIDSITFVSKSAIGESLIGDLITGITPIMENDVEVGYTLTFLHNSPINIYNGKDGVDGKDGTNGTNGIDGISPQLKIEEDYWFISYDNGESWNKLEKAKGNKGDKGDSMFQVVTYDDDFAYFTLIDGTVLTISKNKESVPVTEGTIMATFSVSETKKVYFSKGNLQYNAMLGTHQCVDKTTKSGTWRFSENQWDIIGEDNKNNSSSYNGWIDLFAWGTSGYKYKPDSLYQASTSSSKNHLAISGDIEYTRHDWGYYNTISNADHNFEWRTLNHDEWEYLLSNHDWYLATVNNIKGVILLPESYEEPANIYHTNHDVDFAKYVYNLKTWKLIENQGAVFLPSAGQLSCSYLGTVSYGTENKVTYWTSTLYEYKASTSSSSYSYVMQRSAGSVSYAAQELYYPVRLVRDVEE